MTVCQIFHQGSWSWQHCHHRQRTETPPGCHLATATPLPCKRLLCHPYVWEEFVAMATAPNPNFLCFSSQPCLQATCCWAWFDPKRLQHVWCNLHPVWGMLVSSWWACWLRRFLSLWQVWFLTSCCSRPFVWQRLQWSLWRWTPQPPSRSKFFCWHWCSALPYCVASNNVTPLLFWTWLCCCCYEGSFEQRGTVEDSMWVEPHDPTECRSSFNPGWFPEQSGRYNLWFPSPQQS